MPFIHKDYFFLVPYEQDVIRIMKLFQEYYRPTSIDQAFEMMNASSGPASLLAGGTDLLLDIRQGRIPVPHTLVDITSIPELGALEIRSDRLFIGAAVPLSKIAESQLVSNNAHVLQEACRLIGGPQVRNVATLGGNVAHALPAADGTIAMMCLDTMVVVASHWEIKESFLCMSCSSDLGNRHCRKVMR